MNDSFGSPSDTSCQIDGNIIDEFFEYEEKKYIETYISDITWNKKYTELCKFRDELCKNSEIIKLDDFYRIRKYAISQGGFLTNELRKEFYKRIFCIDYLNKDNYELVYINEKSPDEFVYKSEPFDTSNIFNLELNEDTHIIHVDVKRSRINMLFNQDGYADTK